MTKRYPIAPLVERMAMSANAALSSLGVSGSTLKEYRTRGVSEQVAERLAVKAGLHPYLVWPELCDDIIASVSRDCITCGESFVPGRKDQRHCSRRCRERAASRRYRANRTIPESLQAARVAYRKAYYARHAEHLRADARRRYWEKRSCDVG